MERHPAGNGGPAHTAHTFALQAGYANFAEMMQDSVFNEEDDEEEQEGYPLEPDYHTLDVLEDGDELEEMAYREIPRNAEDEVAADHNDSEIRNKLTTVDEFFKCLICYEKAVKPLMCPNCSKFCCTKCFKKWLHERRNTCPYCRHNLDPTSLVKVRFIGELSEVN